jgi:hypothetical protein
MNRFVQLPFTVESDIQKGSISTSHCHHYQLVVLDETILLHNGEKVTSIPSKENVIAWAPNSDFFVICSQKLEVYTQKGILVGSLPLHHHLEPSHAHVWQDFIMTIYPDGIAHIAQFHDQTLLPLSMISFRGFYTTIHTTQLWQDHVLISGTGKTGRCFHLWRFSAVSPFFSCELSGQVLQPIPYTSSIHSHVYQSLSKLLGYSPIKSIDLSCMDRAGSRWATVMSAELQVYQIPNLSMEYRISITELIQTDSNLENESIEGICFWDQQTIAVLTSHGRLGIAPLDRLQSIRFSILPLGFPFSVSTSCAQLWVLHVENRKYALSTCFRVEKNDWLDYLIEKQRFVEALQFSREWGVDSDFVYQQQWSRNIQLQVLDLQVLSMISDKVWVLQQCLSVTFSSSLNTRLLIEYGIGLTDRITKENVDREIERVLEDDASPVKEVGWPTVMDLFFNRANLIKRLRKLDLFEKLFEKAIVDSRTSGFDISNEFAKFCEKELVQLAGDYATEGNVDALFILFTYHGAKILPLRLAILDLIPCVIPPESYQVLLPKLDANGVVLWKQQISKKEDWTEVKSLVEFMDMFHEEVHSNELPSKQYPEAEQDIVNWYRQKIEHLEEFWGLTSFASSLCTIAKENGVRELEEMDLRLQLMSRIRQHSFEFEMTTWSEMLKLPSTTLIPILLNATNDDDPNSLHAVLYAIKLAQVDWLEFFEFLVEFCVSQPHRIPKIVCRIQQDSKLAQHIPLGEFVHKCAYHDTTQDIRMWQTVIDILKRLDHGTIEETGGWDVDMEELDFDERDSSDWSDLETHVQIAEMYEEHGAPMNLHQVKKLASESGKATLSKLFRQSHLFKSEDLNEWKRGMEKILIHFGSGYFHDLQKQDVYHVIASFALSRGQFQYAQTLLYPSNQVLYIESNKAERLILEAAVEFYDNDQVGDKTCGLLKQSIVW